jgi:hypothetical protein
VVAVISVKSKMTLGEIESGVKNLMSVAPLDCKFRANVLVPGTDKPLPAIAKFLVFYSQPESIKSVLPRVGSVVSDAVATSPDLSVRIVKAMTECDPFDGHHPSWEEARRALPRLIATIEPGDANFVQGWGPSNSGPVASSGSSLQRLPWMYRCDSLLTTSLEKLVFLLLREAFRCLASPALSSLSSWGDLDPTTGIRIGSVEEAIEGEGVALVDARLL